MELQNKNHAICSNCEEVVSKTATRCPYCQCDLTAPFAMRSSFQENSQVQPLNPSPNSKMGMHASKSQSSKKEGTDAPEVEESVFDVVIPLIALLSGGFFVFFALFLKFFSKEGRLILTWRADAAPYFLIPAMILLIIGFFSFSVPKNGE